MSVIDPSLLYLTQKVAEQRSVVAQSILSGSLPPNEYSRLCGVLQGFGYLDHLIAEIEKLNNGEEGDVNE